MKHLHIFLLLIACSLLFAQAADSLGNAASQAVTSDSTQSVQHKTFDAKLMKAAIDSLCIQNRDYDPFVQLREQVFFYHSAYHMAALPAEDLLIRDHGFTVRQSPFGPGYEIQKRLAFSSYDFQGRTLSFSDEEYPYPAALASTEFGIGGQDMNYANLNIRKNDLFGMDHLSGRFSALLQRGIWGYQYDNSTLEDLFLQYSLPKGNLQFHSNTLDWDIPRFQHIMLNSETTYATIREKSVLMSLYWQNKWLNAGFQSNHVNWMAHSLTFSGKQDFWQFLMDREFHFDPLSIQIRYEHFAGDEYPVAFSQFITSPDLDDLASIRLKYNRKNFNLTSTVYGSNPEGIGYDNEWQFLLHRNINLIALCNGFNKDTSSNENRSRGISPIPTRQYSRCLIALQFSNAHDQWCRVGFGSKMKSVRVYDAGSAQYETLDDTTPNLDVLFHAPVQYRHFLFEFNAKMEAPYFQSSTDVRAIYQLPYQNRILCGVTHTYRDKFFLDMDLGDSPVYSDWYEDRDNLLDAYAGLQITNQFDIRFTVKNILDQQFIFSQYLMPITYLLNIRWDFIN